MVARSKSTVHAHFFLLKSAVLPPIRPRLNGWSLLEREIDKKLSRYKSQSTLKWMVSPRAADFSGQFNFDVAVHA